MPLVTKNRISEQVLYRVNGGTTTVTSPVQKEDVIEALSQIINTLFKTQHLTVTLQLGETIPDGLILGDYSATVTTYYGKKAQCTMPIMPVSLPRDMGVFQVSPNPDFSCCYIWLPIGTDDLLSGQPLLCDLLGQIGYSVKGRKIIFNKDITINNITTIYLRLAVFDMSLYDDFDILPIPADAETTIVEELVKQFAPVTGKMKISDIIAPQPISKQ